MRCNVKRLNGYGTLDGLALPRAIERKKERGTRGTNSKETITGAMIRRYRKNGAQEEGQQERRQRRERERGGEYDIGNAYLHVPCGEKCKEREEREERGPGNATTLKMRIEKREKREDRATRRWQERRQRRERERERESMTLKMRIYKRRERRKRTGNAATTFFCDDIRKERRCDCPEHERA